MNIQKELEKSTELHLQKGEASLKEVKALLSGNEANERKILNQLGLNAQLLHHESITSTALSLQKEMEMFEGQVFTAEDIEKMGLKYRLYLRHTSQYRGKIPADLAAILLRFSETHLLSLADSNAFTNRFFILAPPKMFKNYITVRKKISDFWEVSNGEVKSFIQALEDPLMFYRTSEGNYKLLKKWGGDVNLYRRLLGLLTSSLFGLYVIAYTILITGYLSIQYILWNIIPPGETEASVGWDMVYGCSFLITSVFYFIGIVAYQKNHRDSFHHSHLLTKKYFKR